MVRVGGQLWSSELDVMQRALQQRWVRSNGQVERGCGAGGGGGSWHLHRGLIGLKELKVVGEEEDGIGGSGKVAVTKTDNAAWLMKTKAIR
jgi:hypothetical protein